MSGPQQSPPSNPHTGLLFTSSQKLSPIPLTLQAAKTEYFQWLAFQSGLQSRLFDDGVVIDLTKII